MAEFTVEITGDHRDHLAQELKDRLTTHQGQVQIYAEPDRMEPLTAVATVVSVVLSAVQAADVISKWWQQSRERAHKVTIRTASDRVIELSNVDPEQLEQLLEEED
jgi:hypothetical protein